MDVSESFVAGWVFGATRKSDMSPRQCQTLYPDVDTQAFLNGVADGMGGDRFRLDHDRKHDKPCSDCGTRACRDVDGLCALCLIGRQMTARSIGEMMS